MVAAGGVEPPPAGYEPAASPIGFTAKKGASESNRARRFQGPRCAPALPTMWRSRWDPPPLGPGLQSGASFASASGSQGWRHEPAARSSQRALGAGRRHEPAARPSQRALGAGRRHEPAARSSQRALGAGRRHEPAARPSQRALGADGERGIEPRLTRSERVVLPLHQSPTNGPSGSTRTTGLPRIRRVLCQLSYARKKWRGRPDSNRRAPDEQSVAGPPQLHPQSGRGGRNRTSDLLVPNQARFRLRYTSTNESAGNRTPVGLLKRELPGQRGRRTRMVGRPGCGRFRSCSRDRPPSRRPPGIPG